MMDHSEKLSACLKKFGTALAAMMEKVQCSICLNVLEQPAQTKCKHIFCNKCITGTLNNQQNCPLCRDPISRRQIWPALALNEACKTLPRCFQEIDAKILEICGKSLEEVFPTVLVPAKSSKTPKPDDELRKATKRGISLMNELVSGTSKKTKASKRVAASPSGSQILARLAKDKGPCIAPSFLAEKTSKEPQIPSAPEAGIQSLEKLDDHVNRKSNRKRKRSLKLKESESVSSSEKPDANSARQPAIILRIARDGCSKDGKEYKSVACAGAVNGFDSSSADGSKILPEPSESSLVHGSTPNPPKILSSTVEKMADVFEQKFSETPRTRSRILEESTLMNSRSKTDLISPDEITAESLKTRPRQSLLTSMVNAGSENTAYPVKIITSQKLTAGSLRKKSVSHVDDVSKIRCDVSANQEHGSKKITENEEQSIAADAAPLPVKKRFSRQSFDLDAETENVRAVLSQNIPFAFEEASSEADASFVTCPTQNEPIISPEPSSVPYLSVDPNPPNEHVNSEMSVSTVKETETDSVESRGTLVELPVGASEPPASSVIPETESVSAVDSSLSVPCEIDPKSSFEPDSNTRQCSVDAEEDCIVSETDEETCDEDEVKKEDPVLPIKPVSSVSQSFAEEAKDEEENNLILGTPTSQRRRSGVPGTIGKEAVLETKPRPRFTALVTSSLTARENVAVQKFVKRFNVPYARDFSGADGCEVSHVIVHQDEETGGTPRTMKYLMGISRKNYVVTVGWLLKSLREGALVDEDEFVAVGDEGPKKTLEVLRKPLDGITICIKSWEKTMKLDELKTLATNMGAVILSNLLEYTGVGFLVVLVSEESYDKRLAERLWGFGAALVCVEWLIECVSTYSCVPLYEYFFHVELRDSLLSLDFEPAELFQMPMDLSQETNAPLQSNHVKGVSFGTVL